MIQSIIYFDTLDKSPSYKNYSTFWIALIKQKKFTKKFNSADFSITPVFKLAGV